MKEEILEGYLLKMDQFKSSILNLAEGRKTYSLRKRKT